MKINTESNFFIYHEPTETTLEKLTWKQLHSLCNILNGTSSDHFYFWMQGEDDWVPLKTVIGEILDFNKNVGRNTPPPPRSPATESNTGAKVIEDSSEQKEQGAEHTVLADEFENREFTRYKKSLRFTLDISGHLVKVKSLDVSITGIGFTQKVFLNE
ncbi:MAG: PilZ domain-containing protein, partial [Pseudomonadota bacterium]